LAKRCKVDKKKHYVLSQKILTKKVVSAAFKENSKAFENSPEDVKRSIAVFYSSGVMGKRKYSSVRLLALSRKKGRKQWERGGQLLLRYRTALFQNCCPIISVSKKSTKSALGMCTN